jgi:2-amino-4-hydroxy-6-hydroxymethyldihydropteridine diphosphokinase
MNRAFLLIGGNIGDRLSSLRLARLLLAQKCGRIISSSDVYETAAWGNIDQSSFLNQAIELETSLAADELLACALKAEQSMGRERKEKYGPRIIDIDILLFNNDIIEKEQLSVPHPQLPNRRFALRCLCDIAAEVIHPIFGKTIKQLLSECVDPLEVRRLIC